MSLREIERKQTIFMLEFIQRETKMKNLLKRVLLGMVIATTYFVWSVNAAMADVESNADILQDNVIVMAEHMGGLNSKIEELEAEKEALNATILKMKETQAVERNKHNRQIASYKDIIVRQTAELVKAHKPSVADSIKGRYTQLVRATTDNVFEPLLGN
ncbi:hypothetical protein N9112_00200 [bacterium]|nr:hypothetical protein [bacterium]